jgi:cbb3-type cytochrome oxidase subunit 3
MEMIREGLLRIWVICTILFFAAVGAWFFRPVQKEFQRADFAERIQSSAAPLIPIACRDARGTAGADYRSDIDQRNCWYDLPKFRIFYPEYQGTPDGALAAAMIERVGWHGGPRRPWIPLLKLGAAAIALPLLVLLWGWALLRLAERLYRQKSDGQ